MDDVVAGYLDSVTERELDPVVLALLQMEGCREVHLIHGSFEFGKDFIAKRPHNGSSFQLAIQSKVGNLGMSDWRTCKEQLLDSITNSLAHPSFDNSLPRQAVLLTTGRLSGGAPIAAQELNAWLQSVGSRPVEIWDRDDLQARLGAVLQDGVSNSREPDFLSLAAKATAGSASDAEVERFSRSWLTSPSVSDGWSVQLEAACLCNRLRQAGRSDIGAHAAMCLNRAATFLNQGLPDAPQRVSARRLFAFYADEVYSSLDLTVSDASGSVEHIEDFAAMITYPVRCMRTMEQIGLRGWLAVNDGDMQTAQESAQAVVGMMDIHPGTSHPISDRWAISLIPSLLLVARVIGYYDRIEAHARNVAVWLCDYYEHRHGLANPYASIEREISYFAGDFFEHVDVTPRQQSYLATVLLDLCWVLGLNRSYDDILNDVLAVGIVPSIVGACTDDGFLNTQASEARMIPNIRYNGIDASSSGPAAPHHRWSTQDLGLALEQSWFELFSAWCTTRDRHFPAAMVECVRA